MKLEELLGKYEINNKTIKKFHEDLLVYYDISKEPMLSKITEMKCLNTRQLEICKEYKITQYLFFRNLNFLEEYKQLSGGRN